MNVSINFPDELENALHLTAAAAGTDIETFVKQIVAERLAERDLLSESDRMSPQDFAERQAAWVKLHPVLDHAIDDSRESFYAGRD
jgi:plasmid stability protein